MSGITAANAAVAARAVVRFVKRELAKDGQNAYGLVEDWTLPRLAPKWMVPDYTDEALHIESGVIRIRAYEVDRGRCDGATWAPETLGQLKAFIGALMHDRWYSRMEQMAAAWGWSVRKVRRYGDYIFGRVLLAEADRLSSRWERWTARNYARVYLAGVRVFGGVAHAVMQAIGITAAMCLLSGCSGCSIPEIWEDGGASYDTPHWSYSNIVTGATAEGARGYDRRN